MTGAVACAHPYPSRGCLALPIDGLGRTHYQAHVPSADGPRASAAWSWAGGLPAWLARHRRLVAVVALALVVRALLPVVLRRVLVAQASKALGAPVTIGDVDLALWRCGVALDDVAVRAPGAEAAAPPLIGWKRLALSVRWLPLLRRTIALRTFTLDGARLALERGADGTFNLAALLPPPAPASAAAGEAKPAAGAGWSVGVDRLMIRDAQVRFHDGAVPESEPVDVELPAVDARDVALRAGLYGEPAQARLAARVGRGTLRVDARLALAADGGIALTSEVRAKRLPLEPARVYVPHVGWRALRGMLAAALRYRWTTGTENAASGTVWLTDVGIEVPGLAEPALAWRRLAVAIGALDLASRRVVVRAVDLEGPAVVLRPGAATPLPLLAEAASASAPADPPPAAPWRWVVGAVRVTDGHVHLRGAAPLDVGLGLEAEGLAGDAAAAPAHVKLALAAGEGSVGVDGALGVVPVSFDGAITVERLDLAPVVAAFGALTPGLLQKGQLGAALRVAASSAPAGTVRVTGSLTLREPWLAAADPHEFAAGARALDVRIDEIRVPGVLAPREAPGEPIGVRLVTLALDAPSVQLTRAADGLVLPPLVPVKAPPPPPPAAAARPAPGVDVRVGRVSVRDGYLAVTDRTVTPFYTGDLRALALDVEDLRWPALAMRRLRFAATGAEKGRIEVTGRLAPSGGELDVNGREIALRPFNPYATAFSAYSVRRGRLTLAAKAVFGPGGYDAHTALTLHDFDLASRAGDPLFEGQFGIPLSVALALLRDVRGNIALDVPVEADAAGTRVGVLTVIGQALRRALLNALASPLKLVGAVFGSGEGKAAAPAPILFRPGRAELTAAGDAQVRELAGVLASRPGVAVTLAAAPGAADVSWLREQALRAALTAPQGLLGTLRTLGDRGTRQRVAAALEARAHDQPGTLDADDAAALARWLAERPPPPAAELRALAKARLDRVASLLRDRHGIEPGRVACSAPAAEPAGELPAVQVTLGAVGGTS